MKKDSKIYVAGHTGLLGSMLIEKLKENGFNNVITRTHEELDLTESREVKRFLGLTRPEYVFLAAGKTGGVMANKTYPAGFLRVNLAIQNNVFEAAQIYEVNHLVFYGSSCIYPKNSIQPIKENYLLTGELEDTSKAYATAKIAGIIACSVYNSQYNTKRFVAIVPNTMYGSNDNFDLDTSHVLPALIRRFHYAKEKKEKKVELWGSGKPRREFIFVEDVANASIFAMENADRLENRHYNIGTGVDYSIKELAKIIAEVVGYKGEITWDTTRPDGAAQKLLDSSDFQMLGLKPSVSLEAGLRLTYEGYLKEYNNKENAMKNNGQDNAILFDSLKQKALWVRQETLKIHRHAPETRLASSLSDVEIFTVLYYGNILKFDPKNIYWENRDRFIISKGHGAISLYPILADLGFFDKRELGRVCDKDSFLGGIPDPKIPGFETINGSLGHGLGVACGISIALKRKNSNSKVFVLLGDGELFEGSVWEGILFASHHRLDNLTIIIDNNKISMLDYCKNIIDLGSLEDKFKGFNWNTITVDGHDVEKLYMAITNFENDEKDQPKVIIANTKKGKGVPQLESDVLCHVKSLKENEVDDILRELK